MEKYLKRCSTDRDSYFITREEEDTYMRPYRFETIPQLQQMIANLCTGEKDVQNQKLLSIAAFKCREVEVRQEDLGAGEEHKRVDRGKLPEFTYAF